MIDRLQAVATRLRPLRWVATGTGLFCLGAAAFIILRPPSYEGDRYLIPSLVGLLWSVSAYHFLLLFPAVPAKATAQEPVGRPVRPRADV